MYLSCTLAEEGKPRTGAKPENTMPPAAAPFLAWPPLLLHPWAPALLPGAWCSSAAVIRSALPGLVELNKMCHHLFLEITIANLHLHFIIHIPKMY